MLIYVVNFWFEPESLDIYFSLALATASLRLPGQLPHKQVYANLFFSIDSTNRVSTVKNLSRSIALLFISLVPHTISAPCLHESRTCQSSTPFLLLTHTHSTMSIHFNSMLQIDPEAAPDADLFLKRQEMQNRVQVSLANCSSCVCVCVCVCVCCVVLCVTNCQPSLAYWPLNCTPYHDLGVSHQPPSKQKPMSLNLPVVAPVL